MNQLVEQILEWGRATGKANVRDTERTFDAEAVRRAFRQMYLDNVKNVVGDYRRGYEMTLATEAVGVTNGCGRFVVYYRRRPQ